MDARSCEACGDWWPDDSAICTALWLLFVRPDHLVDAAATPLFMANAFMDDELFRA